MLRLPTVLLRHQTKAGVHHDWLLADPRDPSGRLWTARVAPPSRDWPALRSWRLTVLPPHRRRYLTYQGPVASVGGSVRRIDAGTFVPLRWTSRVILIDLSLRDCAGLVRLEATASGAWRATLLRQETSLT